MRKLTQLAMIVLFLSLAFISEKATAQSILTSSTLTNLTSDSVKVSFKELTKLVQCCLDKDSCEKQSQQIIDGMSIYSDDLQQDIAERDKMIELYENLHRIDTTLAKNNERAYKACQDNFDLINKENEVYKLTTIGLGSIILFQLAVFLLK